MPPKRQHQRRKGDDRDREIPRYGCRTGKTGWDHRRGAESAMKEAKRHGGIRAPGESLNAIRTAYRCDHCGCWHLTSLDANGSKAVEQGKRETRIGTAKRDEAASACSPREWAIRKAAIRASYGREHLRPSSSELTTDAARHYARAMDLAGGDPRAFWRAIDDGDTAARVARAANGERKIAEETA